MTATFDHGIFEETFEDDYLTFRAERVKAGREGDLFGEVTVRSTLPSQNGQLDGPVRVNLLSTRSRNELADTLQRRIDNPNVDSRVLVSTFCAHVVKLEREGEPAVLIRDAMTPADAGFGLEPLTRTNEPVTIFGPGGVGKSTLLDAIALDLHSDDCPAVLKLERRTRQRMGILAYEDEAWDHNARMRAMLPPGAAFPDIPFLRMASAMVNDRERIERFIRDERLGVIGIDSLGLAGDGPPEEAGTAIRLHAALRSFKVGSVAIAHTTKNGSEDAPFGSIYGHNAPRQTFLVKKQQDNGADEYSIGVFCKKSNVSRLHRPLGYRVQYTTHTITYSRIDVREKSELSAVLTIRDRLLYALKEGPLTVDEIAERLPDVVPQSIHAKLRSLKNKEFVSMPAVGAGKPRWALMARQRPDSEAAPDLLADMDVRA